MKWKVIIEKRQQIALNTTDSPNTVSPCFQTYKILIEQNVCHFENIYEDLIFFSCYHFEDYMYNIADII